MELSNGKQYGMNDPVVVYSKNWHTSRPNARTLFGALGSARHILLTLHCEVISRTMQSLVFPRTQWSTPQDFTLISSSFILQARVAPVQSIPRILILYLAGTIVAVSWSLYRSSLLKPYGTPRGQPTLQHCNSMAELNI